MSNSVDAALVFGFISFLQLWGGFGIGAGLARRRLLPVLWGVMVGVLPLYFGIERGMKLGHWGGWPGRSPCWCRSRAADRIPPAAALVLLGRRV